MALRIPVKLLLIAALAVARADDAPNAAELLRTTRMLQAAQAIQFSGSLRVGGTRHPIRLSLDKSVVRYEFTDNSDTLTLRLGEKTSTLEETKGGKTSKIAPAKFDDKVRDSDVTYEDLMLRFLYWPDAKITGEDIITARPCWKVEVHPGSGGSQYSKVTVWIGKDDGALMKAESYGADGRWARRFIVNKVMKRDGAWMLRELRIESPSYQGRDPKPTFLVLDDVIK